MRVVELSNHPGAMLREIRLRPDGDDGGAARYEAALAQHRQHVREAEQARDTARAAHRRWAWLRGFFAVRRARRHPPEPPPATGTSADQQEILMAGIEGEQLVASGLGRVLNDDWTLIRGYRNRCGEIDHLLLGPRGLIAIEGKHRNALVHCAGDHWWFTKFDKYGNAVERGEMTDSRGRSPSQQVNEPASQLESFLRTRGHPVAIERVVLLTHHGPGWGTASGRPCMSRPRPARSSACSTIPRPPCPNPNASRLSGSSSATTDSIIQSTKPDGPAHGWAGVTPPGPPLTGSRWRCVRAIPAATGSPRYRCGYR